MWMSQNLNAREFADLSYLHFFPSSFRGAQFLTNSHNMALTMELKPRIHQNLLVEKKTPSSWIATKWCPNHPVSDPCGWRLKLFVTEFDAVQVGSGHFWRHTSCRGQFVSRMFFSPQNACHFIMGIQCDLPPRIWFEFLQTCEIYL